MLLPFQAGLLAAFLLGSYAGLSMLLVLSAACLLFGLFPSKRVCTAVISLSMCAGMAVSCIYTAVIYDKTKAFDGQSVSVKGYVYDMKEYDGGSFRITVKGRINDEVSARLSFYIDREDYDALTYGDDVTVSGEVYEITDSLAYQGARSNKANGIFLRGGMAESVEIHGTNSHRIMCFARQLRDDAYEMLCDKGGDGGRYLGAMICGDRSGVEEDISEEMYRAGIGHIFAFSGTHIVIMISAAAVFLEVLGRRRVVNTLLLLALTWGLVLFSGLSLSAIRAAVMMSVLLISTLARQRSDPLTSLSIAGFLIAVVSPYSVASNSFLLSFAGSFACSAYADALGERMHKDKLYPPTGLKRTLIAVFCAGLLLMPINALLFGRVSVISPVTNLLMIPVCTLCMILSLAGLVLSAVPVISGALIWYSSLMIKGCITITGALSHLPFASVSTHHYAVKAAVIIISVLPAVIMLLPYKKLMLAGSYAVSAAVMLAVSAGARYYERDRLYIIVYSCYGSDALVAYDTQGTVFASEKGGRLCFEAFDSLYLKRGLCELDGVACGGEIPDMPLTTNNRTRYSSESFESESLGSIKAADGQISCTTDHGEVIVAGNEVYSEQNGCIYEINDDAIEIMLDRATGECRVRRLKNGFDITL